WQHNYIKVEQYMDTDVHTVHPDESVDLVANMMDWQHIRYVPVEDLSHRLVGLVSQRSLLRLIEQGKIGHDTSIADVMRPLDKLKTITPGTTTFEAVQVMRKSK